jgi:hypothetical protein
MARDLRSRYLVPRESDRPNKEAHYVRGCALVLFTTRLFPKNRPAGFSELKVCRVKGNFPLQHFSILVARRLRGSRGPPVPIRPQLLRPVNTRGLGRSGALENWSGFGWSVGQIRLICLRSDSARASPAAPHRLRHRLHRRRTTPNGDLDLVAG